MNQDINFRENYSNATKNSPIKPIIIDNSPSKAAIKISRFNLKIFENWDTEQKRAPIDSYTRLKSYSSTKPRREDNAQSPLCRILFYEIDDFMGQRSCSRNLKPFQKSSKDKQIEHLNFKIRNLIKEKNELKSKIENQNYFIESIQGGHKQNDINVSWKEKDSENSLDVTFKPKDIWVNQVKNIKKFPRDIFRIPKSKIN